MNFSVLVCCVVLKYLVLGVSSICVNQGDECSSSDDCCSKKCDLVRGICADLEEENQHSNRDRFFALNTILKRSPEYGGVQQRNIPTCTPVDRACASNYDCCSYTCDAASQTCAPYGSTETSIDFGGFSKLLKQAELGCLKNKMKCDSDGECCSNFCSKKEKICRRWRTRKSMLGSTQPPQQLQLKCFENREMCKENEECCSNFCHPTSNECRDFKDTIAEMEREIPRYEKQHSIGFPNILNQHQIRQWRESLKLFDDSLKMEEKRIESGLVQRPQIKDVEKTKEYLKTLYSDGNIHYGWPKSIDETSRTPSKSEKDSWKKTLLQLFGDNDSENEGKVDSSPHERLVKSTDEAGENIGDVKKWRNPIQSLWNHKGSNEDWKSTLENLWKDVKNESANVSVKGDEKLKANLGVSKWSMKVPTNDQIREWNATLGELLSGLDGNSSIQQTKTVPNNGEINKVSNVSFGDLSGLGRVPNQNQINEWKNTLKELFNGEKEQIHRPDEGKENDDSEQDKATRFKDEGVQTEPQENVQDKELLNQLVQEYLRNVSSTKKNI